MPRYLIERRLGTTDLDEVERASEEGTRVRLERFPDVAWEHSHLVQRGDEFVSYCVYRAESVERLRELDEAAGLPSAWVEEIETDFAPPAVETGSA